MGNSAVRQLMKSTRSGPLVQTQLKEAAEPNEAVRLMPAYGPIQRATRAQGAGQVEVVTLSSPPVIQRWNDLADDPIAITADKDHPALKHANGGASLASLRPYKFDPVNGTFAYQAPSPNIGVENFMKRLLADKTAAPYNGAGYPAEALAPVPGVYKWQSPKPAPDNKLIDFHPGGLQPPDPNIRIAAATNLYDTQSVTLKPNTWMPGPVLDGLKSENAGKSPPGLGKPRAFVSIADEDNWGAAQNAHNQERHVLEPRMNMPWLPGPRLARLGAQPGITPPKLR